MTFILIVAFSIVFCYQAIKNDYMHTERNPIMFKIDDEIWNAKDVENTHKVQI